MQPSPAWKSDCTFPPLEEPEAHLDASELPADASTIASPDIATLVKRLNETLSHGSGRASPAAKPAASGHSVVPLRQESGVAQASPRPAAPAPKSSRLTIGGLTSGLPIVGLLSGLVGVAFVPMSFLFFLWWQDTGRPPQETAPAEEVIAKNASPSTGLVQPEQSARALEVALSSPVRLEANAGEVIAFPVAIDATAALQARSLVAVSGLPQGASFSAGHPYGDTGWSLRTDETADLQLRLPAQSATTDLRLELIAGDGTVLARSATQLSIAPPQVATVDDAIESAPVDKAAQANEAVAATSGSASEESVSAETTGSIAPTPQEPSSAAANQPDVKVNTVKTVAVEPPSETRPHDGANALSAASEEPQAPAEWMETKTAVDMHAKAQQSSETVKVADGGLKVRVTARDGNWIQVTDPASSTTGWIYNRFLKPAEAPAE